MSAYKAREVIHGPPPLKYTQEAEQILQVSKQNARDAQREQAKAKTQRAQQATAHVYTTARTAKATAPTVHTVHTTNTSKTNNNTVVTTGTKTTTKTTAITNAKTTDTVTTPTTTIQKEKKPWRWKRKHTIISVCIILLILGIVIGVAVYFTKNKDTSETTIVSTTVPRSSTPTIATTQTVPTNTQTNTPTYTPSKTDDHMSKVILYGLDDKPITDCTLYKNDVKISDVINDVRIYDDINKKIKNFVTKVTLNSPDTNQKYIGKIKIKNCKIILKRNYFKLGDNKSYDETFEYAHYMQDTYTYDKNDWLLEPLKNNDFYSYYGEIKIPNYYSSADVYIMSEIILYNGTGNVIVNDKINNRDITEEIEISNIPFSGFKIRNCTITLYSDTTRNGNGDAFIDQIDNIKDETGEVFFHTSKDDNLNDEYEDSKCYNRKSFIGAGYNRIKIVPIRISL
jgi:hypothetical protein